MARTTYAQQKEMYPNASDEDIYALINIQNTQDEAYKAKNYDYLNRLYDEEIAINTKILQSSKSGPKTTTSSEPPATSYAATVNEQIARNEKIIPTKSTSAATQPAAPQKETPISKERAVFATKAADLFKELKRKKEEEAQIAGSLSGPRNASTPTPPLRDSPRGPYTPVKDYGTPGKPNFMPSGPSRDPWGFAKQIERRQPFKLA